VGARRGWRKAQEAAGPPAKTPSWLFISVQKLLGLTLEEGEAIVFQSDGKGAMI
jgi:hypothetical protein